jgi:hypothetical protein
MHLRILGNPVRLTQGIGEAQRIGHQVSTARDTVAARIGVPPGTV